MRESEKQWRYENIPQDKRKYVVTLIASGSPTSLLEFHDKYDLSDYNYACCSTDGIRVHLQHWLKRNNEQR